MMPENTVYPQYYRIYISAAYLCAKIRPEWYESQSVMRFFGQGLLDAVSFGIPGNLQRRLVNYALTRFLGSFVKVDVTSDELQLSLSKGRLSLANIDLRTDVINARLSDSGFALKSGAVGLLEVVIPWSNLLSGQFNVLVSGLDLVMIPLIDLDDSMQTSPDTEDPISGSVADIAQSFLSDEVSEEPSIISGGVPDSAILQRLLDNLLSNLCIEISQFSLCIQNTKASDLFLDITMIRLEPSATAAVWELTIQGINGYLTQAQAGRDHEQQNIASPPSKFTTPSSDTFSTESQLRRSNILEHSSDQSMYMSAVSELPVPDESIMIATTAGAEYQKKRSRFLHCETSFAGSLRLEGESTTIDISCGPVMCQLSDSEFLSVFESIQTLLFHVPASDTSDRESRHKIEVNLKLEKVDGELKLAENDTTNTCPILGEEVRLKTNAQRININFCTSQNMTMSVATFSLVFGNSYLSSQGEHHIFATFNFDALGSLHGTLEELQLRLDLEQAKMILPLLCTLYDDAMSRIVVKQSKTRTSSQVLTTFVQLECPIIQVYGAGLHRCEVKVLRPTLNLQKSLQKSRVSLTFDILDLALDGQHIFALTRLANANVVDYTTIMLKSPQPILEFIQYETLFEHRERDQRSEQSTLNALKEKSNALSDCTIRASLGKCSAEFDEVKLKLIRSFLHYCVTFMTINETLKSVDAKTSGDIKMVLAELSELQLCLSLHERQSIEVSLSQLSYFQVTNIKNVDVMALDIADVLLVALDRFGEASPISRVGLHVANQRPRSLPMVTARYRRNCGGKRKGLQMLRLAFTDIQLAYRAEMPWVEPLHKLYIEIVQTGQEYSSTKEQTLHTSAKLAIDLNNVSLELNPYIGKSKGLLYFRKSLLEGSLPFADGLGIARFYAGVVDFFLIDNIDCAQNDSSNHKLQQKDPIELALLKLGFVKIANMETAEIIVSLQGHRGTQPAVDLSIVGAIITLHTCADSLATLVYLTSLLRLPIPINDKLKYKLNTVDSEQVAVDVFADIDDNAFAIQKSGASSSFSDRESKINTQDDNSNGESVMADDDLMSRSIAELGGPSHMAANFGEKKLFTVRTQRCFVVWNIHDGYDWEATRSKITRAVDRALEEAQALPGQHKHVDKASSRYSTKEDSEAESPDEVGDLLFNSIYIALPVGAQRQDVAKAINDEIAVADLSDTATHTTTSKRHDAHRSLAYDSSDRLELGRSKAHKVRIEINELDLVLRLFQVDETGVLSNTKITVHDLEVIDNVSTSTWNKFLTHDRGTRHRNGGQPMAYISVVSVKPLASLAAAELAIEAVIGPLRLHVDQDTLEFLTRFFEFKDEEVVATLLPAEEIFFQKFEVQAIPIQIDYKPKRLDFKSLRSGRTTELKNLFILEESSMILKHVVLYGVNGVQRISQHLNDIWLTHIKAHQLGSVLAGVSAVRSVANFGGGLRKLVMEPIAEYQKDGRLMPGIKRGVNSFVRTTGNEAVRLGAKLAVGTQGMLESAEHAFRDSPAEARQSRTSHAVSMYADQPVDLRQGISQAIDGMSKHVGVAREALSSLPRELEEETDVRKAAGAAAKSIPVAVLRPLIGTTEMISKTLLGLRNSMNPEQKRLNDDKYKHRD